MTTVTNIDRKALQNVIRPKLNEKLKELSDELGIQFSATSASYGGTTGTFKIELATKSEDGVVMTRERQDFLDLHELYNLPKDVLDSVLDFGGTKLRVSGLKSRARKNNIVLDCVDGSGARVAPAETVLAVYERQKMKKVG